MTAIHVSIPVRLLEDFDQTLRYNQSRSAKISVLISHHLNIASSTPIRAATTRQLMSALSGREDVDETMKHLLLQILAKAP